MKRQQRRCVEIFESEWNSWKLRALDRKCLPLARCVITVRNTKFIYSCVHTVHMGLQNKLWNNYKSDGERRIGEYLTDTGIGFTYEKPVAVVDAGKTKVWYPDFYLDHHIVIEYLGMNGNPKNALINEHKRKVYQENKLDVIEIYPEDFQRNWKDILNKGIYETLEGRLSDYLAKSRRDSGLKTGKQYDQMSFKFYS